MLQGGKACAAPVRRRHYTPKEASSELASFDVFICVKRLRERCNLPAGNPDRIATNPAFPGRHFIPEAELLRLAGFGGNV